ncbi:MAG: ATPase [Treponema sp.]|nr:ATPase [Treponema sp.]
MARTIEMRLVELMVLRQDIAAVIDYLGKKGNFQFQSKKNTVIAEAKDDTVVNADAQMYEALQKVRIFLNVSDRKNEILDCPMATDENRSEAAKIIASADDLEARFAVKSDALKRVSESYKEASAFSNLKVPYSQLEHLSFLSIRIGKIPAANLSDLKDSLAGHAVVVQLGADGDRIMAVSSKKGRFSLDTELKKFGFVNMEVPSGFTGIPDEMLSSLRKQMEETQKELDLLEEEKSNYAETHAEKLLSLLGSFSVSMQIEEIQSRQEGTSLVYRLTGWVPAEDCNLFMRGLDELTAGRIAIREYHPAEVASVINGTEQVPVKLKHGTFISAFERMIFSYGSPLYGTIDPTPFVAVFFTILFGIMFGDCGQGLVFLISGILMALKVIKVGGWNKFAPIFIAIGISSSIMGLITGEFFGTETVLEPFAHFVTDLFGEPRAPILKVMPSSDPNSIKVIFGIFGVTIALGIIINSIGLVVNVINKMISKKWGSAVFGKTGIAGIAFYWYVLVFAARIVLAHHVPALYDWIVIGATLFFAAFGEPFERLFDGHRPVVENGFGALVIGGVVELIEVVSNYLSSTISFVRVGAFALAHAVLGFIIEMMSEKCGHIGGIAVLIVGNGIVVVLEGMIVAIQVIRLQYYEFFSKFFNETGTEFKPLRFHYGNK